MKNLRLFSTLLLGVALGSGLMSCSDKKDADVPPIAQPEETITVPHAGMLGSLIKAQDSTVFKVKSLKILGYLNGSDLRVIRKMAGLDLKGHPNTDGILEKIDLSGATIVAGGKSYYKDDSGRLTAKKENGYSNGAYYAENNKIGSFMFAFPDNDASYTHLTDVQLPVGVNAVGENAFRNCNLLKEVKNLDKVIVLNNDAFYNCSALDKVTLNDSLSYSFSKKGGHDGHIDLSFGIAPQAFAGDLSLSTIKIPAYAQTIGAGAFHGCSALASVDAKVIKQKGGFSIGEAAFSDCAALKTFDLDSVNYINDKAFLNTPNSFGNLIFKQSNLCYFVGARAFENSGVASLSILKNYMRFNADAFAKCAKLTTVTFGPDMAFINNNSYLSLTADGSVFSESKVSTVNVNVNSLNISDLNYNTRTLSDLFDYQNQVKTIVFGHYVSSVDASIIGYSISHNLTQVVFNYAADDSHPFSISGYLELDKKKCVIKVPAASLAYYKSLPQLKGYNISEI